MDLVLVVVVVVDLVRVVEVLNEFVDLFVVGVLDLEQLELVGQGLLALPHTLHLHTLPLLVAVIEKLEIEVELVALVSPHLEMVEV